MRSKLTLGCLSLAAVLYASSSAAVPITTSGTWMSVEQANGSVANIQGVGTNQVSWGNPFPDDATTPSSSYVFDGVDPGDAPLDGSVFALGDFTHNNFSIRLPSISGATLRVTLDFIGEGVSEVFTYFFAHDETPNDELPCDPAGATECPDVVSIPDASSTESINIGGMDMILTIVGFSTDGGTTVVEQFITEEGQANTARLFARLEPAPENVPEPSVVALVGFALLALGIRRRARRARC